MGNGDTHISQIGLHTFVRVCGPSTLTNPDVDPRIPCAVELILFLFSTIWWDPRHLLSQMASHHLKVPLRWIPPFAPNGMRRPPMY